MKTYEEFLTESVGSTYKDKAAWSDAAAERGYKVSAPTADLDGEVNKDSHYMIAKDKNGNNKGEFNKGKGTLK